jgi:hypothetical protein
MRKISRKRKITHKSADKPIPWLPVDSRFFPDIIRFGHIKGIAKVFLVIEMIFAVLVVTGTFILALLRLVGQIS